MENKKYYTYDLEEHGDERGRLIAIEAGHNVPFDIKRVFYIYDTKKGVGRGEHAHQTQEQVLICMSGSCKILVDTGYKKDVIELKNPDKALYVGTMVWNKMFEFSHGCVLMVISSEYYNREEYITDYNDFLRKVKNANSL